MMLISTCCLTSSISLTFKSPKSGLIGSVIASIGVSGIIISPPATNFFNSSSVNFISLSNICVILSSSFASISALFKGCATASGVSGIASVCVLISSIALFNSSSVCLVKLFNSSIFLSSITFNFFSCCSLAYTIGCEIDVNNPAVPKDTIAVSARAIPKSCHVISGVIVTLSRADSMAVLINSPGTSKEADNNNLLAKGIPGLINTSRGNISVTDSETPTIADTVLAISGCCPMSLNC